MLVHYMNVAFGAALVGYMVSVFALAVRLEAIRRTHRLAKTAPGFGAFLFGGMAAWSYIWSDGHHALKDRWVSAWVVLNRIFTVAFGVSVLGWAFAQSQAGY